ncbi:MAG: hypothetical protein ABEI86_14015, partial [Halobacteriaceae archaeon]
MAKNTNRRSVLLGTGALATGAVGTNILNSSNVSADQEQDGFTVNGNEVIAKEEAIKREYQYNINLNDYYRVDTKLKCLGGVVTPDDDWLTEYRMSAYGVIRRYNIDYADPRDDPDSKRIYDINEHYVYLDNQDSSIA